MNFIFLITTILVVLSRSGLINTQRNRKIGQQVQNQTFIYKLNEQYILNDPFGDEEINLSWDFERPRQAVIPIYENNKILDSQRSRFQCSLTEDACESLVISNFTITEIGQYARDSKSKDRTKSFHYNYFIAGYDAPLKIKCGANKRNFCEYDAETNTLRVKEDSEVTLICSAIILKADDIDAPAEIHYEFEDQKECSTNTTRKRVKNRRDPVISEIELTASCPMSFDKEDKKFSCGLRYINEVGRRGDLNTEIDQVYVNVDVHYGPKVDDDANDDDKLKPSIVQGKDAVLECPIDGNPILYYWKNLNDDKAEEVLGAKIYTLSKLAVGKHAYQCKGVLNNTFQDTVDPVRFDITVKAAAQKPPKKNLIPLIAGIAGGVVGLLIIILIIVFVVKSRGKKGEMKPKNRGAGQPASRDEDARLD